MTGASAGLQPTSRVVFRGTYSYQRGYPLVVGLFLVGLCTYAIYTGVQGIIERGKLDPWGLAIGLIMLSPFLLMGVWLIFAFITGRTLELEITNAGVSYAGKYYSWNEIKWIYPDEEHGILHIQTKKRHCGL